MAKRGRKKKNKVSSLSAADKGHLKRILAKVRQIKANKKAEAPPQGQTSQADIDALQRAYDALNKQLTAFLSRGLDLSKPTNLNTFNSLSQMLSDAQLRLVRAKAGQ